MKRYWKYTFYILLFIAIFFRPLAIIVDQENKFFSRGYEQQYQDLKKAYYSSQYVQKINPGIMPDESFEMFAAGAFLKGLNPILIVHDHPPLGRYIYSLSIILFDNPHTIVIFLLGLSLLGVYLIGFMMSNKYLAFLPVVLFANEPLFLSKLVYTPLPEPTQLPFLLFAFYFFLCAIKKKKYIRYFLLTALMIGFIISTRFFVTGLLVTVCMTTYLIFFKKDKKVVALFLSILPVSFIVLFSSYFKTIQEGYSLYQVLGIQKYIFFYHKSKFILPFTFWDLLFFNRWHTWWGDRKILSDSNWVILWPLATLSSVFGFTYLIFKKINIDDNQMIIALWIVGYSVMLSTGYTSTRYFLSLVPFIYILATSFLWKILQKKYNL